MLCGSRILYAYGRRKAIGLEFPRDFWPTHGISHHQYRWSKREVEMLFSEISEPLNSPHTKTNKNHRLEKKANAGLFPNPPHTEKLALRLSKACQVPPHIGAGTGFMESLSRQVFLLMLTWRCLRMRSAPRFQKSRFPGEVMKKMIAPSTLPSRMDRSLIGASLIIGAFRAIQKHLLELNDRQEPTGPVSAATLPFVYADPYIIIRWAPFVG